MLEQVDPRDPNLPALRLQLNPSVGNLLRAMLRR
jgi:hypothetical protein